MQKNDISKFQELEQELEKLRSENSLYKRIVDKIPFGIQILDKKDTSFAINSAQIEILGLPDLSEGIGKFNVLNDPYSISSGARKIYEKAYQGNNHKHTFKYDLGSESNT